MGLGHGPKQPSVDLTLNANNSVQVSWTTINANEYRIKIDGTLGITTTSNSGIVTVSSGPTRIVSVDAYQNNVITGSISKYVKVFDYVGTAQTWTVPPGVRFIFADVQGAQGGNSGGLGGRVKSYIAVTPGEVLHFHCGGQGETGVAVACTSIDPKFRLDGYNGGGFGGRIRDSFGCNVGSTSIRYGASGGGASDIRRETSGGTVKLLVAGGGGGNYGTVGGNGGGENGSDGGYSIAGPWPITVRGNGATTTSGGSGGTGGAVNGDTGILGFGGNGATYDQFGDNGGTAAGGGGGYYGGGGGASGSNFGSAGGGGGGSGYIDPVTKPLINNNQLGSINSGYRTGNGRILISWFSPNTYSDIVNDGLVLNLDAENYYSYPGSGTTWTDLSGSGNNGTLTNGPTYSSTNSGSIVFDGTNDYILISQTLTTPFTITGFVRYTDQAKTLNMYMNTNPHTVLGISLNRLGGGELYVYIGNGSGWLAAPSIISSSNMIVNEWYQVSFTSTGSGSILYLNGVNVGTSIHSPSGWGSTYYLGTGAGEYLKGNIATTQIYNRALTAAEVKQNYDATKSRFLSGVSTSGLVLHLDARNKNSYIGSGTDWTDLSGSGNNGTLTNGPTYSNVNGGSLVFDGVNDYIQSTSFSSQVTADITAEAWIYLTSAPSDWVRIIGTGGNGGNRTFGLWYSISRTLLWQRYGAGDPSIQPPNVLGIGTWHHIVATTSGSSHVVYLNGSSVGTATASGPWAASGENITIGFAGFHTYHNGRIANAKIYNRALTASEVSQNFNALRGRFGI